MIEHYSVPPHTRNVFDQKMLPAVVRGVIKQIKKLQADAIVVSGHSGLVVGSIVAYQMKIPLVAVRKLREKPKGDNNRVNCVLRKTVKKYVILDDLISDGDTVKNIIKEIKKEFQYSLSFPLLPVAIVLYNSDDWVKNFDQYTTNVKMGKIPIITCPPLN